MSKDHFGNVQPLLDNEEHEHNYEPATKRVMPYGWDGSEKRTLSVDSSGQLNVNMVSGTITGTSYATIDVRNVVNSITTIANPVSISNFSGSTIYAVVNTGAVGNTNALATLLAGPNQIGSVTVSNQISALATVNVSNTVNSISTIANASSIGLATVNINNTINALATVNVANALTVDLGANNDVVLSAGTAQVGSVTISNMMPLVAGTAYIGLASVNVGGSLPAGTNAIGKLAANSGVDIGDVDVLSIAAGDNNIGNVDIVTVPALVAGTAQIGSVTVSNTVGVTGTFWQATQPVSGTVGVSTLPEVSALATVNVSNVISGIVTIAPRTDFIGLASVQGQVVNLAGTAQIGSVTISNALQTGTNWVGLATVALGAGVTQIGSVTISNPLPAGTATIGIVRLADYAKTFQNYPIALGATNLSGSTIFIAAASSKFHVTNIMLSCASAVGVAILSGATYLVGNPSIRMQLAANSGFVNTGSTAGPVYHALADQQNFLIVTDTASPVAGSVSWYEE